jgi:hypothetical protein
MILNREFYTQLKDTSVGGQWSEGFVQTQGLRKGVSKLRFAQGWFTAK